MQTLNSDYVRLCEVDLPYRGRQKYMHAFDLSDPVMEDDFDDYLDIVIKLCDAARAFTGTAYMTVDEKEIKKGNSQRRPKPHVDGCFTPKKQSILDVDASKLKGFVFNYIEGGWSHNSSGWLHHCNNIKVGHVARMPVIVVSNVPGCRAWKGTFQGDPTSDGDLSHISDQLGEGRILPPNVGYLLSPDCVHESMIMEEDVKRTFLRIALPVGHWDLCWA